MSKKKICIVYNEINTINFRGHLIEAFQCGVPVVNTNFDCAKELITKDNGLICESRSSEELARCIQIVSEKTYDKAKIQEDVSRRFGLEKICKQYESTLLEFYEKQT